MPDIDFAHAVGLVLAIPILLVVLLCAHLARPPRKKTMAERMLAANPGIAMTVKTGGKTIVQDGVVAQMGGRK